MTETLPQLVALRDRAAALNAADPASLDPADRAKTLGMVDRLLDRVERTLAGSLMPDRMPWSASGFTTPEEMAAQAAGYLEALEAGRDPLAGRFAEPGGAVIDHALIEREGLHHLFYIRGRACTHWPDWPTRCFGHAVSRDLRRWEARSSVLQCPDWGWDEFQVWAPHIIEHDGEYWMFYTGVNERCCQAVGLARSRDLFHWQRHGDGPLITPGPWGMWDARGAADCRDPMVLADGDRFYCYYTAARATDGGAESCVGVSSSSDLLEWRDEGFIRLEHSHKTPPESPFVVKREGSYYLFYTSYDHGTVYAVADNPVSGWREPAIEEMVLEAGVSASEVYHTGGEWYLSVISHEPNQLHLFELRRLNWGADGSVKATPL